jgi:hypothetical protein
LAWLSARRRWRWPPPPRNTGGLAEIGDNPDEWVNVCVADTYDVEAVVAK